MKRFCLPILSIGVNTGGKGYPEILDDTNTVAWVDFKKDVTKDGGNLVSSWGDQSGMGNDLLQATPTNQPLLTSDGVLFDGVDNYLKAVGFAFIQPEFIYAVLRQVSWTVNEVMIDGNSQFTGALRQTNVTPNVYVQAGATSGQSSDLIIGSFSILRILINGAGSKFIVDDHTPITGNFGASNMGGLTLGRPGSFAGAYANFEIKELIARKIADTAPNEQIIYNYLKSKYSL